MTPTLTPGKITDPTDSDLDSDPAAWLGMMENMCNITSVKAVEYRLEDKSTCLTTFSRQKRTFFSTRYVSVLTGIYKKRFVGIRPGKVLRKVFVYEVDSDRMPGGRFRFSGISSST